MSLFGQSTTLGQPQASQGMQAQQNTGAFGQSQQNNNLGGSMMVQQQQSQQMPTLSQSQAQLSSSLWQPGKETPRECISIMRRGPWQI